MNPIKIIKDDHRKVEKLFKEFEAQGDKAFIHKKEIVDMIIEELTLHAEMEEQIAYPLFENEFNKEGDKKVEEAFAEHGVVKTLMKEIQNLPPENPQFDAKVKVLIENVNHHVKEEEEIILPKAEKEISEEKMEEMARKMSAFKGM